MTQKRIAAIEARLDDHHEHSTNWITRDAIWDLLQDHKKMRAALEMLYSDTASYIQVNNLGDVHHNQSMQMARAALKELDAE